MQVCHLLSLYQRSQTTNGWQPTGPSMSYYYYSVWKTGNMWNIVRKTDKNNENNLRH